MNGYTGRSTAWLTEKVRSASKERASFVERHPSNTPHQPPLASVFRDKT
jgi:hypothetical protein